MNIFTKAFNGARKKVVALKDTLFKPKTDLQKVREYITGKIKEIEAGRGDPVLFKNVWKEIARQRGITGFEKNRFKNQFLSRFSWKNSAYLQYYLRLLPEE